MEGEIDMIKSTELRIGNLVLMEAPDGSFQKWKDVVHPVVYWDLDDDTTSFKGIPLTEEWLRKFGFVYDGGNGYKAPHGTDHWYHTLRSGFMPNILARGSIKSDLYKGVEYVHQLQNLYFALTGEELTIKE